MNNAANNGANEMNEAEQNFFDQIIAEAEAFDALPAEEKARIKAERAAEEKAAREAAKVRLAKQERAGYARVLERNDWNVDAGARFLEEVGEYPKYDLLKDIIAKGGI